MSAKALNPQTVAVFVGLGAAALLVAFIAKKGVAGAAAGAVGAVADAAAGTVVGIGEAFGIPATNADRCAQAKADGDTFAQSLYCPAPEFIKETTGRVVEWGGDVFAGTVQTAGDVMGIPRTSETACEQAQREGRTWDASFACPAGSFLSYLFK